jgi:hypothetical protein
MVGFKPWRKEPPTADATNSATITPTTTTMTSGDEKEAGPRRRWNLGILSDAQTDEVPGKNYNTARFRVD